MPTLVKKEASLSIQREADKAVTAWWESDTELEKKEDEAIMNMNANKTALKNLAEAKESNKSGRKSWRIGPMYRRPKQQVEKQRLQFDLG